MILKKYFLKFPGYELNKKIIEWRILKKKINLNINSFEQYNIGSNLDSSENIINNNSICSSYVKSFIKKSSQSLSIRAKNYGYFINLSLTQLHNLLKNMLIQWSYYVQSNRLLNYLSLKVKLKSSNNCLKNSFRTWIGLTPLISHRVFSWIVNNKPRKHDEYVLNHFYHTGQFLVSNKKKKKYLIIIKIKM